MHFGSSRHANGTNRSDVWTTLCIMRAQWWPCARLFPVPLLCNTFLDRGHVLIFPVFDRRLIIKRVAWLWLLCFLNFFCCALSDAILLFLALSFCFLPYPFVSCLILLFGDSIFSGTRLSGFCAISVLSCCLCTLPALCINSQGRSSALLNETLSQFPSSASTGAS